MHDLKYAGLNISLHQGILGIKKIKMNGDSSHNQLQIQYSISHGAECTVAVTHEMEKF
jgi:hypothetical protein